MAPDRGRPARARQHHPASPATLCARVEPGGERLGLLRSNKLANRTYETYDDILDACADAWNWLTSQPERITAIAARPWAQGIQ
jgi:hypothetical protein